MKKIIHKKFLLILLLIVVFTVMNSLNNENIQKYNPFALISSSSLKVPTPVVLSPNTTLTSNTEKTKIYTIKYTANSGTSRPTGCNQKEYRPNIENGKNTFGPFDYPVTLTFNGTVDDNLMINGVIVDKTMELRGGTCSHKHAVKYTQTIPKGKTITISAVDQYGVEASLVGTLTLTNTLLKDTILERQKLSSTASQETGDIIATFERGMTKKYSSSTISCFFNSIFKSTIEKCLIDFTPMMAKAVSDKSIYGEIINISSIHNHPIKAISALLPNQNYSILPPSTADLNLALGLKRYAAGKNYAVDANNVWEFSFQLMTGKTLENAAKLINAAEEKRAQNLYTNAQNYINTVNANGGYISKVNMSSL